MFVPFVCCDCDVTCNSKGEGKDWTKGNCKALVGICSEVAGTGQRLR